MTNHKKPYDPRNRVAPPPAHHPWFEPPAFERDTFQVEPQQVLAQNVGPKAAPPDGGVMPPPVPGQSGESYGFKEAGRYVGEAAGKVLGSEFGENGKWAGGEIGKTIGEGVGEVLDWAAGPVPPPVDPPRPTRARV